jgi:hypothetical protein
MSLTFKDLQSRQLSRVVYRVVRLREDSLQLPRPNPVVQQQARPLRVTTACIHIYGFKQWRLLESGDGEIHHHNLLLQVLLSESMVATELAAPEPARPRSICKGQQAQYPQGTCCLQAMESVRVYLHMLAGGGARSCAKGAHTRTVLCALRAKEHRGGGRVRFNMMVLTQTADEDSGCTIRV